MVGVVTTTVFVVIGLSLVAGGNEKVGAVLLALGLLRGSFATRQISILFESDEDDEDDQS